MSDQGTSSAKQWHYQFAQPGGVEIETGEYAGDDAAEARGRELSGSMQSPVIISRRGFADWEYVTEVDERR